MCVCVCVCECVSVCVCVCVTKMMMMNNKGPKIKPCGTPIFIYHIGGNVTNMFSEIIHVIARCV